MGRDRYPPGRRARHKYSQLGIIDRMQEGPIFGEKYVPRGTLLWNGYAQYLVCCGKLFLVGPVRKVLAGVGGGVAVAGRG
jgi:hypothetical protein